MKKRNSEQASPRENNAPVTTPGNQARVIVAIVVCAVIGLGAFVTTQRPSPPPPAQPATVIERGEAITAPVELSAPAEFPAEVVTGDAILAGVAPEQRKGSPKSLWNPDQAPQRPLVEPSKGTVVAPVIKDEEARRRLELADQLKLEKEEALSFTDNDKPLSKIGEYTLAGFNVLANFRFETKAEMLAPGENPTLSAAAVSRQIPQRVKDLNEKLVAAQGFMMPVKGSFGEWSEFLLVRNRANCCYGKTPTPNEWIMVRTAGKGVEYIEDEVVTVYGTLHVGDIRQQGAFAGIYEMNCERVERANKIKAK